MSFFLSGKCTSTSEYRRIQRIYIQQDNQWQKNECPRCSTDVGRILRTFKIKKNVEVTDNGKIII
ncbi:hypothetical protein B5F87_18100 [Eubacterium sp. An3]|nr:hypothetical protein B5F87_18100 [Eubacterium sp. An3]